MICLLLFFVAYATTQEIDCMRVQDSLAQTVLNVPANSTTYPAVVGENRILFFDLRFTNTRNESLLMPLVVELMFNNQSKNYTLERVRDERCVSGCVTNRLEVNSTFLLRKSAVDYGVQMGNDTLGQLTIVIDGANCAVGVSDPPELDPARWVVFGFTVAVGVGFAVFGLM